MVSVESLLSARLFLVPKLAGERIYFVSNLSGRLSLYAMDAGGSVPEPLLPPSIALQNPVLAEGHLFHVFPELGRICVMIDRDGDENYQPMIVPLDGGIPEPEFGGQLADCRVHLEGADSAAGIVYLVAEMRQESTCTAYQGNLATGELTPMFASQHELKVRAWSDDHAIAAITEQYSAGDITLRVWEAARGGTVLLFGAPINQRGQQPDIQLTGFSSGCFTGDQHEYLSVTSIFEDTYGLGRLHVGAPHMIAPVRVLNAQHAGTGSLESIERLQDDRYLVGYNIDGISWLYEGRFDQTELTMTLTRPICGAGRLENGVLESVSYDGPGDRFALSFSSATSPSQLYLVDPAAGSVPRQLTRERVLAVPQVHLSPGEDASYTSFDGLRISARLYLPASDLGFQGPRPLVYYIHGGPQGQERPDFAWFSMPLIQLLTLSGFAVFVPNVRGSTGYGLTYMRKVDRDWGGDDRLDHVHAMKILGNDPRLDVRRAGVVGRSYGGYMTLTLAARHSELWSAAVDMFGPSNLLTFLDHIPATWRPTMNIVLGDAVRDRDFLVERSPITYIRDVSCPMLVIQGKNDPRVVESESRLVVETLREMGKSVEFLLFENEGHDILKHENRVICYSAIAGFFAQHLRP
jgi:pimeloyl-ACP methyl ester carboxylesterase